MKIKQVTISERYRIPLKSEISSGLWVDRIGHGIDTREKHMRCRILGLYAAVGIKEGNGEFYSETTGLVNVGENDVILLFPDEKHYYNPDMKWETYWIVWNGRDADKLIEMKYFLPSTPIIKNGYSVILKTYNDLEKLMNKEDLQSVMVRKVLLLNMLLELYKYSFAVETANAFVVKKAVDFIDNNVANDLSIRQVACHCGFSETHFRRIFKEETGISPRKFIINRKILKAKELLFARIPAKEVADILGFKNEFYFRTVFKKVTGITPGKFTG